MSPKLLPRLALLHYTSPPVIGGVESVLGIHACLLKEAGYDLRIISGEGNGDGDSALIPEIWSRHPEVEQLYHQLGRGEVDHPEFRRLQDLLSVRLKPLLADRDLVIAHNILTMPFNLPLAAALAESKLPILAWTHDLAWVNPRYKDYQRAGYPYDLLHSSQPLVTYVAISRVRQQEISKTLNLPLSQIPIVSNGIDVADFLGLSNSTRSLMQRGGFGSSWPTLLIPFRITRRKRLEWALEAVALLLPNYPNLRLVISGPLGPHNSDNRVYMAELQALRSKLQLEKMVCFLHELAGPDGVHPVNSQNIAELYRLADCVLLPSESEGFGLPILEAGLDRVPIVSADLEILRELAGGNLYCFRSDGGATALAESTRRALGSRSSILRRRVLTQYAWPSILQKIEALVKATAKGLRPAAP